MPAEIRVDYKELNRIGQHFENLAEVNKALFRNIETCTDDLRRGGWISTSANIFFADMYDFVLPAMNRLTTALEESSTVIYQIAQLFHEAEDEAAALFGQKETAASASPALIDGLRGARDLFEYLFTPASINSAVDRLRSLEAGKQLEQYLKDAGLTIYFPDGSTMGAENGQKIEVVRQDANISDAFTVGGYYDSNSVPPRIVISDSRMSNAGLASTMGHEIIHAIDDAKNQLDYDAQVLNQEFTAGDLADPKFKAQLEDDISNTIEAKIKSEIRAYEMSHALSEERRYQDDGVYTNVEKREVFTSYRYESFYEEAYSEELSKQLGVPVEVNVDYVNGEFVTQVHIVGQGGGAGGAF